MKNVKLVIWDMDGTLVDSLEAISFAMNKVLSNHHYPIFETQVIKEMIGNGLQRLCRLAFDRSTAPNKIEDISSYFSELLNIYGQSYDYKMTVYPGIFEALKLLNQRHCYLAVNTNKQQSMAEAIIHDYFEDYGFHHVLGVVDDRPKKPDPTAVKLLLKIYNLSPQEVLYIGDSDVDMKTAQAAGVNMAAVTWGFRGEEVLAQYQPTVILRSPHDLLKYLDEVISNPL